MNGVREKSGWEYLELLSALAIPIVLAAAGFWVATQRDARQLRIENQRAADERELAEQQAQNDWLQTYLDQMGMLLLEKDLRSSKEDSEVRTLARARTLTVLGRLDPSRKTTVMEFLVEAELIQRVEGKGPVIDLSGANLRETELGLIALRDIFPSDVHINLSGAKGISNQKLFRKAKTLEGASMPTGQTYEDWLKGRGPD